MRPALSRTHARERRAHTHASSRVLQVAFAKVGSGSFRLTIKTNEQPELVLCNLTPTCPQASECPV